MKIYETPCGCGCGEIVLHTKIPPSQIRLRGEKRFVGGHQNLGRVHSEKTRMKSSRKGAKNGRWKGGRRFDKNGYVILWMPEHPNSTKDGYVREHRYVMEQHLGRLLERRELVHHLNHQKNDNRLENLQVVSHAEHQRIERTGKKFVYGTRTEIVCVGCGETFKTQPSRARRKYCSRQCWASRTKKRVAPNRYLKGAY